MPDAEPVEEARAVERLRAYLQRRGSPRVQMTVIVAATGAAGFLVSFALLHLGLRTMWLRYTLAIALAYGVFLLLVGAWLALQRRKLGVRAEASRGGGVGDLLDVPGSGGSLPGNVGRAVGRLRPGGGSFGGGGSSASFAGGQPVVPLMPAPPAEASGVAPSGGARSGLAAGGRHLGGGHGGFSLDLDGDDLVVIVAVVAAIGAAIGASVYVIVTAPTLLAEVMFDGALSAGLYRRLRVLNHHRWWEDAVRHTCIPALIVTVFFGIAGYLMHRYAPEAASMAGVLNPMLQKRS